MNEFVTKHMVKVAMGVQQLFRLQTAFFNKCLQPVFFAIKVTTRINDEATVGFIIKYIRIFLYGAEDKAFDIPHVTNILTIKGYFYGWR